MIRRVGRYELHEELAAGGMGSVHLGLLRGDRGFSRVVAIKQMHPHLAGEGRLTAMFLEEARLAERIRHANVVTTLDVVADGPDVFIVMDLVVGQSLRRLMADGEPVPSRIVVALMRDVLRGLHAVHTARSAEGQALGLVHRDVSPHNILVAQEGAARLLDFGVAKATGVSLPTPAGSFKGKLAYIAPEQLRGEPVDARGDLFGLGVTAWEALTGRRLFRQDDGPSTVARVMSMRVPPPSAVAEGVDPVLERVIMGALERATMARFASAQAMEAELEAAPRADEGEVSRWLETRAVASLAELRERVRQIERGSDRSDASASSAASLGALERSSHLPDQTDTTSSADAGDTLIAPSPPGASPSRRVARIGFALLAALLLLGGIASRVVLRSRAQASEAAPVAAASAPWSSSPFVARAAPSAPAPSASADPGAPAPSASAPTPASHRPSRRHPSHTAPCDPPYDLDADGIKHWKRACLP